MLRIMCGWLLAGCACIFLSGCVSGPWNYVKKTTQSWTSGNSLLSRVPVIGDPGPSAERANDELEDALELYRQGEFSSAQGKFNRIAYGRHTPARTAEKALFYEGECYRMRQQYPYAAQTYSKMVMEFPRGVHHYDALQRMFDIANYWLDETRSEMEARIEQKNGKRWWVQPVSFVHIGSTKPMFDQEGHALALLEKVYLNDIDGPLGEKALFFLGSVHFFREHYQEADHYFYQVVRFHPNGKHAARAMELSIICKQVIPGGPDYDGRKVAEARELVHQALQAYPELAHTKGEFLQRQLYMINNQQATKDYMVAEFYARVGKPASAYFYYEIVRRRYPGTEFAQKAAQRMESLRDRVESGRSGSSFSIYNLWPFNRGSSTQQPSAPTDPNAIAPGGSLSPGQPGGPELAPAPRRLPPSPGTGGVQPAGGAWPN